jgi:hypothetical protein
MLDTTPVTTTIADLIVAGVAECELLAAVGREGHRFGGGKWQTAMTMERRHIYARMDSVNGVEGRKRLGRLRLSIDATATRAPASGPSGWKRPRRSALANDAPNAQAAHSW